MQRLRNVVVLPSLESIRGTFTKDEPRTVQDLFHFLTIEGDRIFRWVLDLEEDDDKRRPMLIASEPLSNLFPQAAQSA